MNVDPRPRITASQIIWIVACVILITSLFLIGAWLFKPAGGPEGKEGATTPGEIREQEVNAVSFAPEGQRPVALTPPPEGGMPPANALIPTPPALETRLPSQMAKDSAKVPIEPAKPAEPAKVPVAVAPSPEAPSKPAAEAAGAKEKAPVKQGGWFLQAAAVSDKGKAGELKKTLAASGFPSATVVQEDNRYKVRIPCKDEAAARAAKKKLDAAGLKGTEGAFVVKPGA